MVRLPAIRICAILRCCTRAVGLTAPPPRIVPAPRKRQRSMDRTGTSVSEFFSRFPDATACLEHIFSVRWGDHTPCPRCRELGNWSLIKGYPKYRHSCGAHISVREGTIFYRSNLSMMAWFYALLLFSNSSQGMRMQFIRRQLGLGTRSTCRMCLRIRYQMAAYDRPAQLGGPGKLVHVDELFLQYVRGQREVILWGCACEGHVLTCIIPDRKAKTMLSAIERFVAPGSIIVTDQHASYKQLTRMGWPHVSINHARSFHLQGITNNMIEVYWATVRRTLLGYRSADREYLWLYLAELEWRYNHRHSAASLFDRLISSFPVLNNDSLAECRARFDLQPSKWPAEGMRKSDGRSCAI